MYQFNTIKMRVKLLTSILGTPIVVNLHIARAVQAVGKEIYVYHAPTSFFQKLFGIHDIDIYTYYSEEEARHVVEEYLRSKKD